MPLINLDAVLNPLPELKDHILDYIPRATTSEFGIVALGSGINVDIFGRIYLDTQEYSDRLTAIETTAASTLETTVNNLETKADELAASITQKLGTPNGIATLDSAGSIPSSQLPSYVDDVLEYASVAAFPATGETGKIYVETIGNTTYRWSGTTYVKITSGEVSSVAGKKGIVTLTKGDVGLSNVDNTNDLNKPLSTATQTALTALENKGKRGIINLYDTSLIYGLNERVMLTNGDIVKSTIDGNVSDPNVDMTGWGYAGLVENRTYPPVLGSPVKFMLNPSKFSLRYGLSDPLPLDNNTNMFRGLTNKDAWAEENIGGGSVAFGRNGASVAYLTTTFGHDCITYGVASTAGGAGSGTGNPDAPTDGANYGYCSFAHGKDTAAIGRISTAFGQECKASSIHSYASGMQSEAGAALASHPNGVASDGESAWAHGYRAKAYGDFSFALGSFVTAYNGAQVIGRGINPGSPLVNSRADSLAIGFGVDVPNIITTKGDGTIGGFGKLGINTADPRERVEINLKTDDKIAIRTNSGGASIDLQGTLTDGTSASITRIEYTSENGGQAYGQLNLYQNGSQFLNVNHSGEATFEKRVVMKNRLEISSYIMINGEKILGSQQPAIADSTGTAADNQRAINAILTALRSHGLIAT